MQPNGREESRQDEVKRNETEKQDKLRSATEQAKELKLE